MQTLWLVPFRLLAAILLAIALVLAALPFAGRASASDSPLLISEYVSGSGNNKALEIYNSGPDLNLSAMHHSIEIHLDDSSVAAIIVLNSGFIAEGEVWVVAHPEADADILAAADQHFDGPWFDGNDLILLVRGGTPVDRIGSLGLDPGTVWGDGDTSTADNTLRRQESIATGDPDFWSAFDPSAQWVGAGLDVFDGLGCWGESACATAEDPAPAEPGTPFDDLRDLVDAYRADASLAGDAADALAAHLDRAEHLLEANNVSGAKGQLRAFKGRLRGFESRGLAGTGEAATLAAASQELIDSL